MKTPVVISLGLLAAGTFQCSQMQPVSGLPDRPVPVWGTGGSSAVVSQPVSGVSGVESLRRAANVRVDMVPKGTHGRKVVRRMTPRYITIHSTQNYSADASRHSLALKRGALRAPKRRGGNRIGYLIWHYTIDENVAIQHMPTDEQGEHADFDGPGNRYSIGLEMCENRGADLQQTIDRTARLTAYLMHKKDIPLSRVVPHQHWPRKGTRTPNKNCPHFLMENGRPGRKWQAFKNRVNRYYLAAQADSIAQR